MLNTEYIRSLNANYERLLLGEKPEEKRYQYCMISRGGIRGLLPCSLRYIDGNAYLYYDITSRQNIAQLFDKKVITRQWLTDFLWSMRRVRMEMSRFLLEEGNIVWFPGHIYQDLEKNDFHFIYIPYCSEDTGFQDLMEYLIEHVDYQDEEMAEYLYKAYEQYETAGRYTCRVSSLRMRNGLECRRNKWFRSLMIQRTDNCPPNKIGSNRRGNYRRKK